jgi:hypothetical protein
MILENAMKFLLLSFALASMVYAQESRLDKLGIDVHGFADYRYGQRTQSDTYQDDDTLNEARFQLDLSRQGDWLTLQFKGDFIHNPYEDDSDVDLERGEGFFDLREFYGMFSPTEWMDVKIGRQILTWGTGEYLFVNDMFPKDWQSYFLGRDDEYLKAPSDAAFASFFADSINIDVAFTPRFDPDRFITGEYISFYNGGLGRRSGDDAVVDPDIPDEWFKDYELAVRAYRNIEGYEVAAYLYDGYWKSPGGMDPNTGQPIFPDLSVYGASVRGNLASGIANLELGYYDSTDDSGGSNPMVNNSEVRWLAGYQREIAVELTMGLQYYVEWMMDYGDYKRSLPVGAKDRDEMRHVVTLSLRKMMMSQKLSTSLFAYYSPSDKDSFIRPQIGYKHTDAIKVFAGANIFSGSDEHTFFNQFEHNSNVYAGLRYTF